MSPKEIIALTLPPTPAGARADAYADFLIRELGLKGYAIVPKEPTEAMILAGIGGDQQDAQTYRQMVAAYDGGAA